MSRGVVVMPPSAFPTFNHFNSRHFLHVNSTQNASSALINDALDSCGEEVTSPVDDVFVTSRFVEPISPCCSSCGVGVCANGFRSSSRRPGDVTTGSHVIDDNGNDILQSAKRCDIKGRPLMDNASRGFSLDSSSSSPASSRRAASAQTGSSSRKLSLGSAISGTSSRPNNCIRATVCELPHHHVPHDSVLHIRSRDRDPIASCRDIQAILLQIRDTLSEAELRTPSKQIYRSAATSPQTTTNGHREPEATSVRLSTSTEQGKGKECIPSVMPLPISRPTIVTTKAPQPVEHRPTVTSSCRQHCHSLTESPNTTEDDEDGGNHRTPASASRKRSSVRFADEVGMNLNTFVMIPPRRRLDRSASPMVNGDVGSGVTAGVCSTELSSPVPEYLLPQYLQTVDPGFTLAAERRAPRTARRPVQLPTDDQNLNPVAASLAKSCILPCLDFTPIILDPATSRTSEPETSPKLRSLSPPSSIPQEMFRLCFEQPFADLEKFREKLDTQLVCLENVRLEDYEARSGGTGSSGNGSPPASTATASCASPHPILTSPASPPPTSMTMTANSVILVSIKVKNVDPEKRVFARCTDNNWQTHADLPAQYVGGVDNLGREYDRFCVAVRRPSTGPSTTVEKSATPIKPAAAVEFAICYQVNGQSHWDNNDRVNYRVEWFDSTTSSS